MYEVKIKILLYAGTQPYERETLRVKKHYIEDGCHFFDLEDGTQAIYPVNSTIFTIKPI